LALYLQIRPIFLIPIVAAVSCTSGHQDRDDEDAMPLAVVDLATGAVQERWPAPALLFDVAVDPISGRVWGVTESEERIENGSRAARVVELLPDGDPIDMFELAGFSQLSPDFHLDVGVFIYWHDLGHLKLDAGRRRAAGDRYCAEQRTSRRLRSRLRRNRPRDHFDDRVAWQRFRPGQRHWIHVRFRRGGIV
jgi:hypothetical protein